jgi:flagellar biosynthesis protein FlhB
VNEKTEQATPTRLKKAREDGDAGVSSFASQAVAFLVAVLLLSRLGVATATKVESLLRESIMRVSERAAPRSFDPASFGGAILELVLPLLLAVGATSAAVSAVQAGGVFAVNKLAPDVSRLDPIAGFMRLFSWARLFSLARALVGAAFVTWMAWLVLRNHAADFARTSGNLRAVGGLAGFAAFTVARYAAVVGLLFAVVDVVVTRQSWMSRLRMGKDELKRERKDSEGDPQVKAGRERARHDLMASATIGNVKNASVVVVNPTHIACALRYDDKDGDAAPVVVATGQGDMATRIIQAAHAYGVPVLRDVPLARALVELEVGDVIPEALYEAVAEILKVAWESPP